MIIKSRAEVRSILNSMSPQDLLNWKIKNGYDICPRCDGSGKHSYNSIDKEVCFKCKGLGYAPLTKKEVKERGWRK